MIEVRNLTKRYGHVRAVNDISFTVADVGVYGFLGPNGAGKSTTMNILTGCLAASSGTVTVNGHDIFAEPIEAKSCIGYLPENPPLYTDMTPEEYLTFVAQAKGIPSAKVGKEVDAVMKRTGVEPMKKRLIKNLSKGYKQRVGIAQAILGDPDIIILDEPTVGLDPLQIIEIRKLIRDLGHDHTVILSSHILPEISEVCDYVIVIAHGKIVVSDTLANLNRSFSDVEIIRVTTATNPDKLRSELEKIEGAENVSVVETADGVKAEINVKSGMDIRLAVSDALRSLDAPVLSFTSTAQNLEDIFIRLVNEQYTAEDDPARPAEKKIKEKPAASPKGNAYYEPAKDPAEEASSETETDTEEEYKPLFGGDENEGGEN